MRANFTLHLCLTRNLKQMMTIFEDLIKEVVGEYSFTKICMLIDEEEYAEPFRVAPRSIGSHHASPRNIPDN